MKNHKTHPISSASFPEVIVAHKITMGKLVVVVSEEITKTLENDGKMGGQSSKSNENICYRLKAKVVEVVSVVRQNILLISMNNHLEIKIKINTNSSYEDDIIWMLLP